MFILLGIKITDIDIGLLNHSLISRKLNIAFY